MPTGAIAEAIEINLREAQGEHDLPPLPELNGFILMQGRFCRLHLPGSA